MDFEKPNVIILSTQRSGTQFLGTSLASHPKIHFRSECILVYNRYIAGDGLDTTQRKMRFFTNRPDRVNLAIVMYNQVSTFEQLCGPLFDFKIIHLVRSADDAARSLLQLDANKKAHAEFSAHYRIWNDHPANVPIALDKLRPLKLKIEAAQQHHRKLLSSHQSLLEVSYSEATENQQMNELPEQFCRKVLNFLNLDFYPLHNLLKKTG